MGNIIGDAGAPLDWYLECGLAYLMDLVRTDPHPFNLRVVSYAISLRGLVGETRRMALSAKRIVRQNLGWAVAYNLVMIPLAVSGMLNIAVPSKVSSCPPWVKSISTMPKLSSW